MPATPETDQNQPTRISIGDVATRYLDSLQRIFDIVNFTMASSRKISEQDYEEFSHKLQIMPRQEARMDFEKAKDATEQWCLRNSLGDAVSLIVPLMEDCRTIAALCEYKMAGKNDAALIKKIVNDDRQTFFQLPVPEKFRILKDKYSIEAPVQEHVESLLSAARCLLWKQGLVSKEDVGPDEKLHLKIRSIQLVQVGNSQDTLSLSRRMADTERVFAVGEKIELSKAEHLGSVITVGIFVSSILQSLQVYAQKTGAADDMKSPA
jgi:hypothetical protein